MRRANISKEAKRQHADIDAELDSIRQWVEDNKDNMSARDVALIRLRLVALRMQSATGRPPDEQDLEDIQREIAG